MNTIKVTRKMSQESEVMINLPFFGKVSRDRYIRVDSGNEMDTVVLESRDTFTAIVRTSADVYTSEICNSVEITEQEWDEQWVIALNRILPKPQQIAEPQG